MKKLIISCILSLCAMLSAGAQNTDNYFPYPKVPDDINELSQRCNYLVDKFWDHCNVKQSFSSISRLDGAFGDWISFMPYATVDTVFPAIDRYLQTVAKTGGENLLTVGRMAEKWIYCDSAEYFSEQLFLPFAKAVSENKKVQKDERARFSAMAKVIESSGLGMRVPNIEFIDKEGNKRGLDEAIASRVVLIFVDPESFDCTLAKARLSADYNLSQLVSQNLVKVVALYPNKPTDKWTSEMDTYPESWIVGSMPAAYEYFKIDLFPSIYYLDGRHKVLGKGLGIDQLLLGLSQINQNMSSQQ